MLFISIFSIQTRSMNCSNIIWMFIALVSSISVIGKIMWKPSPFCPFKSSQFFPNSGRNSIFHSMSRFFSVFNRISDPIVWEYIGDYHMNYIDRNYYSNPLRKRSIRVECIFLEISIHFIACIEWESMRRINFRICSCPLS